MNTIQFTDGAAYSRLFDILSSLYLHHPTPERVAAFNAIAPTIGVDTEMLPVTEGVAALTADYDALFLVPVSGRYLPPFESAQRTQRLWGPLTHQVADLYQSAGFESNMLDIDVMWQNLNMPDHIGIELAFFSALLATHENAPAPEITDTVNTFAQKHLFRWAPDFGEKLAQQAHTSLYRLLGTLTRQACDDFAKLLPGLA